MRFLDYCFNNKEELFRLDSLLRSFKITSDKRIGGDSAIIIDEMSRDCYGIDYSKDVLRQTKYDHYYDVLCVSLHIYKDKVKVHIDYSKNEHYINSALLDDKLLSKINAEFLNAADEYKIKGKELKVPVLKGYSKESNVYLMTNTRNGYTKIGVSNKPKYRERTLQSQEPEVELIYSKLIYDAYKAENELHEKYSNLRVRGEWFELNDEDIKNIKQHLDNIS